MNEPSHWHNWLTGTEADRVSNLNDLWRRQLNATRVLEPGTKLFHGGVVRGVTSFNPGRPTWFGIGDTGEKQASSYANMSHHREEAQLLSVVLRKPVTIADFGRAGFSKFTKNYCTGSHDVMGFAVRAWGLSNRIDGIYFSLDKPEVMLFQPGWDLLEQVT